MRWLAALNALSTLLRCRWASHSCRVGNVFKIVQFCTREPRVTTGWGAMRYQPTRGERGGVARIHGAGA
jgi:hypothetical protein